MTAGEDGAVEPAHRARICMLQTSLHVIPTFGQIVQMVRRAVELTPGVYESTLVLSATDTEAMARLDLQGTDGDRVPDLGTSGVEIVEDEDADSGKRRLRWSSR